DVVVDLLGGLRCGSGPAAPTRTAGALLGRLLLGRVGFGLVLLGGRLRSILLLCGLLGAATVVRRPLRQLRHTRERVVGLEHVAGRGERLRRGSRDADADDIAAEALD